MNVTRRGRDWTKASAKEKDVEYERFKVSGINADCPGKGDWTRPVMTQTACQCGKVGVRKLRFSRQHLGDVRPKVFLIELAYKLSQYVTKF